MPKNRPLAENYPADPREMLHLLDDDALLPENKYYISKLLDRYLSTESRNASEIEQTKGAVRKIVYEAINNPDKALRFTKFLLNREDIRSIELLLNGERTDQEKQELDFYLQDVSEQEHGVTLSDVIIGMRENLHSIFENENLQQVLIDTFGEKTKEEWWGMVQQEDWYQRLPHESKKFLDTTQFSDRFNIWQKIKLLLSHKDDQLDIKHLKGVGNYFRLRIHNIRVLFSSGEGGQRLINAILPRDKVYKNALAQEF